MPSQHRHNKACRTAQTRWSIIDPQWRGPLRNEHSSNLRSMTCLMAGSLTGSGAMGQYVHNRRNWVWLSLVLVVAGCASRLPAGYMQDWKTWHDHRVDAVSGPGGWMMLAGLHWLEDGDWTIGSDSDNDIVLARGPTHLGQLQVNGDHVRFAASQDSLFGINDGPDSIDLVVDTGGIAPTVLEVESLSLFVIKRGGLAVRVMDSEAPAVKSFAGIEHFPVDPRWRIEATFESHNPPRTLEVPDAMGFIRSYPNPGRVIFSSGGQQYALEAVTEPGEARLFLIFADRTNGKESYGGGRFLYSKRPENGTTIVDFNRAFNPPCVFTRYANCPLPPPGNRLRLAVTAGEKNYRNDDVP